MRATVALRPVLAELGAPSIPTTLNIPSVRATLSENPEWLGSAAEKFLNELDWYADALRMKRRASE